MEAQDNTKRDVFNVLGKIKFADSELDRKNGLTYVSWAVAWQRTREQFPDAQYQVIMWEGRPYKAFGDLDSAMVATSVTIQGETHNMWLPVMNTNGRPRALKLAEINTFDINTSIMRCLVKNLAMFGLGLYIYQGEDTPSGLQEYEAEKAEQLKREAEKNEKLREKMRYRLSENYKTIDDLMQYYNDLNAQEQAFYKSLFSERKRQLQAEAAKGGGNRPAPAQIQELNFQ